LEVRSSRRPAQGDQVCRRQPERVRRQRGGGAPGIPGPPARQGHSPSLRPVDGARGGVRWPAHERDKRGREAFLLTRKAAFGLIGIMRRRLRFASGGFVYHVLNRAVGRAQLFRKEGDYAAFMKVLGQAKDWQAMRIISFCLMPNHWHLVIWPEKDGEL